MISLVLPFWNRQKVADLAVSHLDRCYAGLDLEVIIVDDGSDIEYVKPVTRLDLKVVTLPKKNGPMSACVPYNEGVKASSREFIALSGTDIIHSAPILADMRDAIMDDNDYVIAAAFCNEQNRWHCHSSMQRNDRTDVGSYLPPGADYHFMTMLKRSLWDKAGGFDAAYREGAGYEDPDFVRRLHAVGARFVRRDDLIVTHRRTDAKTPWTHAMLQKNRELFLSKWKPLRTDAA